MPNFSGLWTANQQYQAVGASKWPSFPGAPTSVTATASSGTAASVAFTAPSSSGFPATVTSYTVTSSPGGLTGTGSSSPISVTGLTTGTTYTFTVTATNATGIGPSSAASNSVTPANAFVEDVFSTYLYTGTGSAQTITNNIDLSTQGGLVWAKYRSGGNISTARHALFDTARGVQKQLSSNLTSAETVGTDLLSAFNSNGFTLGADETFGSVNRTSALYASWTFRKQPKFFDIVTWTGDGTNFRAIPHSLGSAPGFIITRATNNSANWWTYHRSNGNGSGMQLDGANPVNTTLGTYNWNVTSSTFQVSSTYIGTNTNGYTYVAYIFAHDAGGFGLTGTDSIISCGSVTAPAAGDIAVTLGWEPQWLLIKQTDGPGDGFYDDWSIIDTTRAMAVNDSKNLYANKAVAEQDWPNYDSGILTPTGFIINANANPTIQASKTAIYVAIRKGPMKVPTVGTDVYNAKARTGSGATDSITGVGFTPDLVSAKGRDGRDTIWFDRPRGRLKNLRPTLDNAEQTEGNSLTGFDLQDGVKLGADTNALINANNASMINHFFRRAPSFLDIVVYSGSGSSPQTVSHNLTVVPEMMIVKFRGGSTNWYVYHTALGNTKALYLGGTATGTPTTSAVFWNNTTPTSSQFTVGSFPSGAGSYAAYLFATCPGVSKVGSYTGTGTTLQINCGFTTGARFILIRRTDATGGWYIWDTVRGIISGNDPYLIFSSTAAEVTNTDYIDPFSAGFELSSTAPSDINASGGTYVFLAIA